MDFPGTSDSKASAYNVGDPGSIPGLGRSLEKEMATHSSILAWKIPWTEDTGRLQSMGLQRVVHYWATSLNFTSSLEGELWTNLDSILKSKDITLPSKVHLV